ncbi:MULTISPECIES: glycerol-3-phosphate 1-O-acyltransferase PlsY [Cobetia]|uniref:Glycerol-3-phosphate acyltransferase n=1 Tax=Cobetia crustatorum TaxID=553385 RepID=A0A558HH32_9GAMM|nr:MULTISPECIES: glycerol-3-phosphate 1-O-acyltransferase PlsY [Cobetia]TVU68443.1 glycerol-3-phosphate 1-O-acyltransferase PlsY [Cobetia crustatorum]
MLNALIHWGTELTSWQQLSLLLAAAYACGSILGAVWLCQILRLSDPRLAGSFNPGFSNVLRLHGTLPAMLVLAFDAAKGMPALWLALQLSLPPWALGLVGLAVLVGHSLPLWHRGHRGGKAVAAAFGVLLILAPGVALSCAALWIGLAWRLRTAAIASLVAGLAAPLFSLWLAPEMSGVILVFSSLIVIRHALNLRRLSDGSEPRL